MEERFETFTVLIARISRGIKRIKAEEMAEFGLKGPHVLCYTTTPLRLGGGLSAGWTTC